MVYPNLPFIFSIKKQKIVSMLIMLGVFLVRLCPLVPDVLIPGVPDGAGAPEPEELHRGGHGRPGVQGRKLLSCSQCQELGQRANWAPDWSFVFRQPIRYKVSFLTQLLTLTTTKKFPSQVVLVEHVGVAHVVVVVVGNEEAEHRLEGGVRLRW